ncbi:MAG: hypothetical protein OXU45_02800 [Candidatus Melainabacteria bacterium]|nr:hypothetical protein [Candidatus Melainabacteria bacterium]
MSDIGHRLFRLENYEGVSPTMLCREGNGDKIDLGGIERRLQAIAGKFADVDFVEEIHQDITDDSTVVQFNARSGVVRLLSTLFQVINNLADIANRIESGETVYQEPGAALGIVTMMTGPKPREKPEAKIEPVAISLDEVQSLSESVRKHIDFIVQTIGLEKLQNIVTKGFEEVRHLMATTQGDYWRALSPLEKVQEGLSGTANTHQKTILNR